MLPTFSTPKSSAMADKEITWELAAPKPQRPPSWGLPEPLSVTCKAAILRPRPDGVNVTICVQEEFAESVEVQVVVPSVKSVEFGPVIAMLLRVMEDEVVFVIVIVSGPPLDPSLTVPKGLSLGLKEIAEPLGNPFPKSCTDWGLLEALLVT